MVEICPFPLLWLLALQFFSDGILLVQLINRHFETCQFTEIFHEGTYGDVRTATVSTSEQFVSVSLKSLASQIWVAVVQQLTDFSRHDSAC